MPNPENLTPFEKGKSGNPGGRPKGTRNLSTILTEMLDEEIEVNEGGAKSKKKFADIIVRRLIKKANEGDIKAIQVIFDRTEGAAKQTIGITTFTPPQIILDGTATDKTE